MSITKTKSSKGAPDTLDVTVAPTTSAGGSAQSTQPKKRRMAREPKPNAIAMNKPTEEDRPQPRAPSKIAAVIALLEHPKGATLAEMVEATGWLPHTTRAALTGLKKKRHTITKDKRDGVTCYSIAKAAG